MGCRAMGFGLGLKPKESYRLRLRAWGCGTGFKGISFRGFHDGIFQASLFDSTTKDSRPCPCEPLRSLRPKGLVLSSCKSIGDEIYQIASTRDGWTLDSLRSLLLHT